MDQTRPFIEFPSLSTDKYILFSHLDKLITDNKDKTEISILCLGPLYKEKYLNEWLQEKSNNPSLTFQIHTLIDRNINRQFAKAKKIRFDTCITRHKNWGQFNNLFEKAIIFDLDKDLPLTREYDIIINFHLLHNSTNWRLILVNLLPFLANKGLFIFSESGGTYTVLDGNFKTMPANEKVRELLHTFDHERSDLHHYWRPEISLTNYTELKNQIEFLFDDVVDEEAMKEGHNNNRHIAIDGIKLNSQNKLKDLFDDPVFSYFHVGINKNIEHPVRNKIRFENELEECLCDIVTRKDQIYICSSFNKPKFNKIKERHWNFNSLVKDLDYIKDNIIQSLGRKAIDLFVSHDVFFPGYTKHLTLVPWEYETTNCWSYPLHLLVESNFKDHQQYTASNNLFKLLLMTEKPEVSFLKLLFKQSDGKFPLYISIWTDKDFEEADKLGYQVINSEPGNGKLAYLIQYTRKNNIGQVYIAINPGIVNQILWENKKFLTWFEEKLKDEKFIKKQHRYNGNDTVELKNKIVNREQITEEEFRAYAGMFKETEIPDILIHKIQYIQNEKMDDLRMAMNRYRSGKGTDLLDQIITVSVLFQLQEVGFRICYFPSSIIKNKKEDQEGWHLNGLGGVILYEKLPPNNNAVLQSLVSARDSALQKAVNMIFYKASIAGYAGLNFQKTALISAVSAITARSGAHTIGSHVLPEVSSVLGELVLNTNFDMRPDIELQSFLKAGSSQELSITDSNVSKFLKEILSFQRNNKYLLHDKELFKYLQERIDFIAQFASDLPQWSVVLNFVGDILKSFYGQYHLLNDLGDTEGLSAYEYEEETIEKNWFDGDEMNNVKKDEEIVVFGHCVPVDNRLYIVADKKQADLLHTNPDLSKHRNMKAFICDEDVLDADENSINNILSKGRKENEYYGQHLKLKGIVKDIQHNQITLSQCKIYGGRIVIKARFRKYIYLEDYRVTDCRSWSEALSRENNKRLNLSKVRENDFNKNLSIYTQFWGIVKKIELYEKDNKQYYRITYFNRNDIFVDIPESTFDEMISSFEVYKQKNKIKCAKKSLIEVGSRMIVEGRLHCYAENNYAIVSTEENTPVQIKEISMIEYLTTASMVKDDINYDFDDMQIAIPGGTVGTQAFYIILENIIRNSAKHSWIKLKDFYKCGKNLEIKIELEDHKNFDYYVCKIWSNATDLRYQDGIPFNGVKETESLLPTGLITHIKNSLEEPIIDASGKLNREHLGLSEMKICAAFLAKHDWPRNGILSGETITLTDDKGKQSTGFIRCSSMLEEDGGELVPRLGYRIKLRKLKEVIIIGHPDSYNLARTQGITFVKNIDIRRVDLDYEYCVLWDSCSPEDLYEKITRFIENIFESGDRNMRKEMEELSSLIENYPCRLFFITDNIKTKPDTSSNWNKFISDFKELQRNLNISIQNLNFLSFLRKRVCFINNKKATSKLFIENASNLSSETIKQFKNYLHRRWYHLFLSKEHSYQLKIKLGNQTDKKSNKLIKTVPLNLRLLDPAEERSDDTTVINFCTREEGKTVYSVNYLRHNKDIEELDIYNDIVSGGSKIYSVLKNFSALPPEDMEKKRIETKLIESGLANIMILDERVFNYVSRQKHTDGNWDDSVYNVYQRANILVPYKLCINGQVMYEASEICINNIIGDNKKIVLTETDGQVEMYFNQSPNAALATGLNNYNINTFVIHQTMLDHLSKGLFPQDHNNTIQHFSADKVVFKLKHETGIPSIIITSGKGKLYDSYRYAKYIPFANISDLLLRPDPDKFTMTQTLLQSLNLQDPI